MVAGRHLSEKTGFIMSFHVVFHTVLNTTLPMSQRFIVLFLRGGTAMVYSVGGDEGNKTVFSEIIQQHQTLVYCVNRCSGDLGLV